MEEQHMALILTEEQEDFRKLARDFATKELKPIRSECDREGRFPEEVYRKAFELGFHLMDIPEKNGGLGLDHNTICVILEEFGKVEPALGITMLSTALALECVLVGGNEDQIARASEIIVPGAFGTFALTEPNSGSDSASIRTTAVRDGDEYILNGSKCFATNAGFADLFVIFATVDKSLGAKGITAFMVEKGTPGLTVGHHEDKMGLRLSNTADIALDEVRVPVANRLGEEGQGFAIAMRGLDAGRTFNAAISTGLSQGAIEEALQYSKERQQFGKPICKQQSIAFMLADMQMNTEAGRQLVHGAARMLEAGMKATSEASMAKCFCADNAMQVTTNVVQIMGGYGYSREYPVEKMMRDAKIFQIFEGTNQIQRVIVSNNMIKG
jgi:butyryl-CoA dehydrogenase